MYYHFRVKREKVGFSAICCELKDCKAQAKNYQDLKIMMSEVLHQYLSSSRKTSDFLVLPCERPDLLTGNIQRIKVDNSLAFGIILKYTRVKNNYTQQHLAEKLGYKNMWGYQRLEKDNDVTIKTIYKILKVLPDLPIELLFK